MLLNDKLHYELERRLLQWLKPPIKKERYEALYRVHIKNSPIASIKLNKLTAMDIQKYYNNLILNGKSV